MYTFRGTLRSLAEDLGDWIEDISNPSYGGVTHQPVAQLAVCRPAGTLLSEARAHIC